MHPYDRWLIQHPEDDLPGWVFDYETCPKCHKAIDHGRDYDEYGIEVCQQEETGLCEEEE
tara:strand:- start:282 stop:461 length:180 start_codon:yes stop_codon:yes gene_type:complete